MRLTKRELKRIIREEKQKLLESDFSRMGEDEIIDALSPEEYSALESVAYTLAEDAFDQVIGPDEAGFVVAFMLQHIFPMISNNPSLKKFIN